MRSEVYNVSKRAEGSCPGSFLWPGFAAEREALQIHFGHFLILRYSGRIYKDPYLKVESATQPAVCCSWCGPGAPTAWYTTHERLSGFLARLLVWPSQMLPDMPLAILTHTERSFPNDNRIMFVSWVLWGQAMTGLDWNGASLFMFVLEKFRLTTFYYFN